MRVTWVAGSSGLTALGIDQFFLNLTHTDEVTTCTGKGKSKTCNTTPATGTISSAGWNARYAPPAQQADGFGNFSARIAKGANSTLQVFFTLDNASFLTDTNNFAVHVRYQDNGSGLGCSGFASMRTNVNTNPGPAPGCPVSTPEPNSLSLLGSGLLGLVALVGRRLTR